MHGPATSDYGHADESCGEPTHATDANPTDANSTVNLGPACAAFPSTADGM